jgi:hypothetical protein
MGKNRDRFEQRLPNQGLAANEVGDHVGVEKQLHPRASPSNGSP